MIYLTFDQVVSIHDALLERYGGLPGFRDKGLIDSALATPMMSIFGEEIHKSIFDKAAAYLFSIARNHAFNDGNKRTATGSCLLFLSSNGKEPVFNEEEFADFVAKVAEGRIEIEKISHYLESLCH